MYEFKVNHYLSTQIQLQPVNYYEREWLNDRMNWVYICVESMDWAYNENKKCPVNNDSDSKYKIHASEFKLYEYFI